MFTKTKIRLKESHHFRCFSSSKMVDLFQSCQKTQSATKISPPTHAHVSTHHHHPPNNKNCTQTCGLQHAHTLTWTHGAGSHAQSKRNGGLVSQVTSSKFKKEEGRTQRVGRKRFYNHFSYNALCNCVSTNLVQFQDRAAGRSHFNDMWL